MFAIVVSALNVLLGFAFRSVIVKFGVMFAAWFLAVELIGALVAYVPGVSSLSTLLGQLPAGVWFFLELMRFDVGLPLVVGAFATRFLIRRLPFVG